MFGLKTACKQGKKKKKMAVVFLNKQKTAIELYIKNMWRQSISLLLKTNQLQLPEYNVNVRWNSMSLFTFMTGL